MGRMRKAKKAFKNDRQGAPYNKFVRFQEDVKTRKAAALRTVKAAVAFAIGAARNSIIISTPIRSHQDNIAKALSLAENVIQTAQSVNKILSSNGSQG